MVQIVHSKDIAGIPTRNGFNTDELVNSFLENEFWNLRDQK